MKVIISCGVGKLHFHETVKAVANAGVDVDFLTGWVPPAGFEKAVDRFGRLLREPDLSKRLRTRIVDAPGVTTKALAWAEFGGRGLLYLSKLNLAKEYLTTGWAFQLAGKASCKHLHHGDVFHVRAGAGQGGAIRTARQHGMKVIADHSIAHPVYMRDVLSEEYARAKMQNEFLVQRGLWQVVLEDCKQADRVLANSDFVKRTFVENGYPEDRVDVEYLGVKPSFFHLKQSYACNGPFTILFTGDFSLRKGARTMLEAVRRVRQGGLDVRLHLIGNVMNGKVWIKDSDAEFLKHTPFVLPDRLLPAFAESDVFVFPTLIEGCSRSAMEAAAAGLPVITTENCGLPLVDGKSVLYTPLSDSERLAETIARVAMDESLRESIGRAAANEIARKYTWPLYGEKLRKVYESILGVSTAPVLN